ncbi:MAG TPA: hypothetical protein VF989_01455 [Polyangiaceae bacterium]|jgi:hypothetical protein
MFATRLNRFGFRTVLSAPLMVAAIGLVAIGCGGSGSEPQMANIKPGSMPAGGEWSGVYYSQTYGMLHLLTEGDNVNGAWRTTAGDSWGELYGQADGDVFRYSWTEHKIGQIGEGAERMGKGYFRYLVPKGNEPHEIVGEWGLGESEAGNPWSAIKQNNVDPDPSSVKPDEIEGRFQGGGWDEEEGSASPTEDEEEGTSPESGFGDEP